MSISNLMTALTQGYTSKQIIDWLLRSGKKIGKQIKSAKSQGFSDDQVLTYLTKGKYASHGQKNEILGGMSESEKGSRIFNQGTDWAATGRGIATAASIAAGAYGLARGLPAIKQGAQRLFGRGGPQPMGGAPIQPQGPAGPQAGQTININPTTAPNAPQSPNAAQPNQPLSPEAMARNKASNDFKAMTPEFRDWAARKIEAGQEKPFEEMLKEFQQEKLATKPQSPLMQGIEADVQKMGEPDTISSQNQTDTGTEQQPIRKEPEERPIQKGDLVATRGGFFGSIKDTRNGKALVDVAGRVHQIATGDLISSPLPEKDLADLYDDVIQGIEKETGEEVSRNVELAGYNPSTNNLLYIPHGGAAYVYSNISPEDAKNLTNVLQQRKTTGENYIGAWFAGTKSPIGHEMSNLVRKLQSERGGKGNEYEEKFETIYRALEPAAKASKKKRAEKKKNERKR